MNKNYFVICIDKIKNGGIGNRIGHNDRSRNYKSENVKKELSHLNIVLENNPKIKTDKDILNYSKEKLKSKNRQVKEDSSKFFEIVIDSSKEALSEEENIKYLKDSFEYFKKRFNGQTIIDATIHRDEGKPHLHMIFSYFNEDKGKWTQKELYQQKTTDINEILKDFENKIGKKYNLKKGDKQELQQEIEKIEIKKVEIITEKNKILPNKTIIRNVISVPEIKKIEKIHEKIVMENIDLKRQLQKIGDKKTINNIINNQEYTQQREKALITPPTFLMLEKPDINGNYLIHSPLREDNNKSFRVFFDESKNIWLSHDHATNETYNNIDLYMKLFNTDYKTTIGEINYINRYTEPKKTHQKHQETPKPIQTPTKVEEIQINPYLDEYLKERKIYKIPKQIKFIREKLNGNQYDYISLKNENGGYSCRNRHIKKNINNSDISIIDNNQKTTIIAEGLFDYLSYYQNHENNVNYIVLNSINNINTIKLQKAKELLKNTSLTDILDNDEKSKIASKKLQEILKQEYQITKIGKLDFGNFKDYAEKYQKTTQQQELKEKEEKSKLQEKTEITPHTPHQRHK